MIKRKNFMDLTNAELTDLAQAFNLLWDNGVIQRNANLHSVNFYTGIHWGPAFLPWHRDFLRNLERDMQLVMGKEIALPYWDWTRGDSRNLDSGRWKTFFGGRNNTGGNFDHWTYTRRSTAFGSLPELNNIVAEIHTDTFLEFRAIEVGSHVPGHTWTGGTMAGGSSPLDPLFYLHHCNLDRLWAIWQDNHRSALQYTPYGESPGDSVPAARVPFDSAMIAGATPHSVINHYAQGYYYDRDQPLEDAWRATVGGSLRTSEDPYLAINNFGYNAGGWRVENHPRILADVTGDTRADIIGFGNAGVYLSLSNGDYTFAAPRRVIDNFGYNAGGWRVDRHPRFVADITGDRGADIVGFGNAGVYISLSNGDGTFQPIRRVIDNFGYNAGNWRVERHPRFIANITGNRGGDIVGFGNAGVYIALSNGDGSFQPVRRVVDNFGYNAGGWRVENHPRFLADITGDGRADIVGFGNAGVYVAISNGDGTFQPVRRVVDNFGYNAGGWRVDRHPRFLADLTGNGRADIVGFGNAGVYVALSNGDGTFQPVRRVVDNFGYNAGGWRVENHPRFLADVTGDGRADIVGFGNAGVYVSLNNGDGTFQPARRVINNFGYNAGGWRVENHPRMLADIIGDRRANIIGFGNAGVWLSLATIS